MRKRSVAIVAVAIISLLVIGCLGSGGSLTGGGNGGNNGGGNNGGGNNGGGGGGPVTVDVDMNGMVYTPQVVTAHAGDTIRWTNSGSLPHTVTSDSGAFDSMATFPAGIGQGGVYTFTIPAGTAVGTNFFYHCLFHGSPGNGSSLGAGMSGEITVN